MGPVDGLGGGVDKRRHESTKVDNPEPEKTQTGVKYPRPDGTRGDMRWTPKERRRLRRLSPNGTLSLVTAALHASLPPFLDGAGRYFTKGMRDALSRALAAETPELPPRHSDRPLPRLSGPLLRLASSLYERICTMSDVLTARELARLLGIEIPDGADPLPLVRARAAELLQAEADAQAPPPPPPLPANIEGLPIKDSGIRTRILNRLGDMSVERLAQMTEAEFAVHKGMGRKSRKFLQMAFQVFGVEWPAPDRADEEEAEEEEPSVRFDDRQMAAILGVPLDEFQGRADREATPAGGGPPTRARKWKPEMVERWLRHLKASHPAA